MLLKDSEAKIVALGTRLQEEQQGKADAIKVSAA